jgi:hypothetical protein
VLSVSGIEFELRMTDTTASLYDLAAFDGRRVSRGNVSRQIVRGLVRSPVMGLAGLATVGVLAASATLAAGWIANTALSTNSQIYARTPSGPGSLTLAGSYGAATVAATANASFETRWAQALIPASASASAMPLLHQDRVVFAANIPMPLSRPDIPEQSAPALPQVAELAPASAAPQKLVSAQASNVPLPRPGPEKREPIQPPAQVATASAPPAPRPPASHGPDRLASLPGPGSRTAVYDIAAHTVYLPGGEKLEAHSGLGDKLDDPRYVQVRMRGPTPPNVYDLTLRGELFHEVRAIRLNPTDDEAMHGRAGMLAHPYMLGPNGQSNGCVSFKDYPKFLRAFLNGEVDRLVVVAHLGDVPASVAQARGRDRYAFNNR